MSAIGLRATPVSIAAWATKGGMYQIRRGSNGVGMMYSRAELQLAAVIGGGHLVRHVLAGQLRPGPWREAIFISLLTRRARTSRAPRKM